MTTPPPLTLQVTGIDLLRKLDEIGARQQEVLIKVTELAVTADGDHKAIVDHEGRIRMVERFQWKAIGIATFVASASGVAAGWVTALNLHH